MAKTQKPTAPAKKTIAKSAAKKAVKQPVAAKKKVVPGKASKAIKPAPKSKAATIAKSAQTKSASGATGNAISQKPKASGPRHWLVKSEPFKYSWDQFEKDGQTFWDGVRNYAARNNIRDMKAGDPVLWYHSNEGKEIVGIATVVKEHYQDPGTDDPAWLSVDLKPFKKLKKTVTLEQVKADKRLAEMQLVKLGRLSVQAVTPAEFDLIMLLSEQK